MVAVFNTLYITEKQKLAFGKYNYVIKTISITNLVYYTTTNETMQDLPKYSVAKSILSASYQYVGCTTVAQQVCSGSACKCVTLGGSGCIYSSSPVLSTVSEFSDATEVKEQISQISMDFFVLFYFQLFPPLIEHWFPSTATMPHTLREMSADLEARTARPPLLQPTREAEFRNERLPWDETACDARTLLRNHERSPLNDKSFWSWKPIKPSHFTPKHWRKSLRFIRIATVGLSLTWTLDIGHISMLPTISSEIPQDHAHDFFDAWASIRQFYVLQVSSTS